MRLQKYMAQYGVASRRECEKYISDGRVSVNGMKVTQPGTAVDPGKDIIEFDGNRIIENCKKVYIMFYKPRGVVTTMKEQFGRKNVGEYFSEHECRLYPVGRLDYDTEGLLIMTNDGDFMYKMTHPKHKTEKIYVAKLKGKPEKEDVERMKKGIEIDGKITEDAKVRAISENILEIIIHEGRNRQIRRICENAGFPVKDLKRISIGNLSLDLDTPGEWRYITEEEIRNLIFL